MKIAPAGLVCLLLLLGSCSQSNSLVGKWQTTGGDAKVTWEFAENGAVTQGTTRGRYSLGNDNQLKIETPFATSVYQMEVAGDRLTLTDSHGTKLTFARIEK